ncbi:MAG: HAD-IA family hydrolase [Proteobacteria bacterium]|nr:HAD-IA family hydrolase [Pseudomonadota bacterium]
MINNIELAAAQLVPPRVVLFDWHATLVDTLEAMYHAVDEMLPRLPQLGLMENLVAPELCRSALDARLVVYVREHLQLHPKIKRERKISRTDIFEILFGGNEDAKHIAHEAFNEAYRRHYGEVHPFEGGELALLRELHEYDVKLGILTNREREFFEHEFAQVENGAWLGLFDTTLCGGDTFRRKPNPEPILKALVELKELAGLECWYIGDSATDVAAARRAQVTSIFFNGAGWDGAWLAEVFPGTEAHPYQPHAIVDSFAEFKILFERCWARSL